MSRNFLLIRSIVASLVAKLFGSIVIFVCLPLAAMAMNADDYSAFNYSMAITGLLSILIGPFLAVFVVQFAYMSINNEKNEIRRAVEETLAIFISLAVVAIPLAALLAYTLAPEEHRISMAAAAAAVTITNILAWADAIRVGERQDHISSAFGLANNATIIAAVCLLFRQEALSLTSLLSVYYGSPLFWSIASFGQLVGAKGVRIRWRFHANSWRRLFNDAMPLFAQNISDYMRLYMSSMFAFYLTSPQSYAVFSTSILFVARLTNPFSLLARPLVPAYVDAIERKDRGWIASLKRTANWVYGVAIVSTAIIALAIAPLTVSDVHFGAIQMRAHEVKPYMIFGVALFWCFAISVMIASIYLARRRMALFCTVSLSTNILGLAAGIASMEYFDAVGLFASIAISSCIGLCYLSSRLFAGTLVPTFSKVGGDEPSGKLKNDR